MVGWESIHLLVNSVKKRLMFIIFTLPILLVLKLYNNKGQRFFTDLYIFIEATPNEWKQKGATADWKNIPDFVLISSENLGITVTWSEAQLNVAVGFPAVPLVIIRLVN